MVVSLTDLNLYLKGHAQNRADDVLILAPRIGDLAHRFVSSLESIAQNSLDHGEWDQQDENQRADSEQLDHRAVAFEKGLRFRERWRRLKFGHGGRLNGGSAQSNQIGGFRAR